MKKVPAIILIVLVILSTCACAGSGKPSPGEISENGTELTTEESTLKGTVHEYGRFSVLIPEGWEAADLGGYQADYNGIIVKGKGEDFMTAPSASIIYLLPTELFLSGRGFYENVRTYDDLDLGGRIWEVWSGQQEGMKVMAAETTGEEGSVTVMLNMPSDTSEELSFEDPDIRAILESIVVVPTVEVEWITLKDGIVIASLPEMEGYKWTTGGTMNTAGLEVSFSLEGSQLTITPESGSGACFQDLTLENEEETLVMGEAKVSVRVKDARADAVYAGELNIYDEPKEKNLEEPGDNTDYESLAETYSGAWIDTKNDIALFIRPADEVEHGCLINIQFEDKNISATGVIGEDTSLKYEEITVNGESVDSAGYFTPDGGMLIWGHDGAVGTFEYGTIFNKLD